MRTDKISYITTALLFSSFCLTTLTLSAQQVDDSYLDNSHRLINDNILNKPSLITSSIGQLKNKNSDVLPTVKLKRIAKQDLLLSLNDDSDAKNQLNPALYQTRQQRIKNQRVIAQNSRKDSTHATNQTRHYSFSIFDAYTQLIEDYDGDGFYRTFSVTFDADLYTHHFADSAIVYADLYLSENGGPWIHYFTTDNFIIYGESADDEYEVYTTLNNGYIPTNYDVLIDLYEDGYSDIVATFSANDSNNLYALPLESSNYDPDYNFQESTSHGEGGSHSFIFILALLCTVIARKLNLDNTTNNSA